MRLRISCPLAALLITLGAFCAPANTGQSSDRPRFFTLYTSVPSLMPDGRTPEVFLATSWWFFGPATGQDIDPIEERCRQAAREARGRLLVIDIENDFYPFDIRKAPKRRVLYTIQRIRKAIRWMRDEVPSLKIGLYGIPMRDYWVAINTALGSEHQLFDKCQAELREWRAANDFLAALVADLDYLCPELYTFQPHQDRWQRYCDVHIKEAKRFGKPVLAFLMPEYHPSEIGNWGRWLAADYWRMQLERARFAGADGIIIYTMTHSGTAAPWWQETVRFRRELVKQRVRLNARSSTRPLARDLQRRSQPDAAPRDGP